MSHALVEQYAKAILRASIQDEDEDENEDDSAEQFIGHGSGTGLPERSLPGTGLPASAILPGSFRA